MGFVLTFFSKSAFICPLSDSESAALFEALAAEPNPSATAKVKKKTYELHCYFRVLICV